MPILRERIGAAFQALESFLDSLPPARVRERAWPDEWSVQEIVDHLVETNRPSLDELRCLLAGRRPPGEPIPAGLQSKAPRLRPWPRLLAELKDLHQEILTTLEAAPADLGTGARAPLVMVINVEESGASLPHHWIEELDWKAYAVIFRVHTIDHLNQARKVAEALAGGGERAWRQA